MGLKVVGMDSWRRDLETLPERAEKAIKPVMSRAGVQIKLDWKRRWTAAGSPSVGHIPHLIRALGYDLSQKGTLFAVTIGRRVRPQADPTGQLHRVRHSYLRPAPGRAAVPRR
jgi:hypothetical protein